MQSTHRHIGGSLLDGDSLSDEHTDAHIANVQQHLKVFLLYATFCVRFESSITFGGSLLSMRQPPFGGSLL
jgi:hypothetical protein